MKNIIKYMFLIFISLFSFFYTDKVIDIVNKSNPLMINIIAAKSNYDILPVNAIIDDDTIIPGINGREINVNKSYDNMKIGGVFREEVVAFDDVYPSVNLSDNMDKYIISGNRNKREVAIIYILDLNYIDKIKNVNNLTIFINHNDLNIKNIKYLKDYEIYTYGNNGIYNDEIIVSDNTLINRISNNKSKYCLLLEKNADILKTCNEQGMYVVIPNIIGGYYNIKNNINNGSIILLDNLSGIDIINKYIDSKGYEVVTLSRLLSE